MHATGLQAHLKVWSLWHFLKSSFLLRYASFLIYPQLRLITFLCFTSLCSTCINIFRKTNKTVYVEWRSTFETIIFRTSPSPVLLYMRETGLDSVLLEVYGGGKLCFPVSQQRAGRISATSTRAQTERYTLSWTKNSGLISIESKEYNTRNNNHILTMDSMEKHCIGRTKNLIYILYMEIHNSLVWDNIKTLTNETLTMATRSLEQIWTSILHASLHDMLSVNPLPSHTEMRNVKCRL